LSHTRNRYKTIEVPRRTTNRVDSTAAHPRRTEKSGRFKQPISPPNAITAPNQNLFAAANPINLKKVISNRSPEHGEQSEGDESPDLKVETE
jgi:hypothetical protein